jgi:mRNA interferase RelE/StbE
VTLYRIRYTSEAARRIRRLHPDVKAFLREAIEALAAAPWSGHALRFELDGYRSLRARRYRIVHRVDDDAHVIEIHYVGLRRDVYESFRRLLRGAPEE